MKNISFGQFKSKISFKELYLQLIFGARFHWIFWYQFNLIFLSLIFTIISYIFKNNFLVILDFIAIMSLYLNVSLLLYNILLIFKKYIFTTIGTLIELAPLGVIGFHYNSLNLLSKTKDIPIYFRLILLVLIYIFFKFDIFIILPGFRYSSVLLNLFASTILFIFFNSLLLEKIPLFHYILSHITKFTGGIYYIHLVVRDYITKKIFFFDNKPYLSAVVIYIICYIICFIGNSYFKNSKLKYLFI